jgi:hypothetical protein
MARSQLTAPGIFSMRGLVRFRFLPTRPSRQSTPRVPCNAEIEWTAGTACCVECLTPCVTVQSRARRAPGRRRPASLWTAPLRRDPRDAGNPAWFTTSNTVTDENTSENPFDQWRRAAQALKAVGIGSITYRYDGHSGLTGFLSIELWDADHLPLPDDAVSEDVMIDFGEFLILLLSTRHPRWYRGAGSHGLFEWFAASGRLRHVHHARSIQVKTFEYDESIG